MSTIAELANPAATDVLSLDHMWLHGLARYFIEHGATADAPNRREIARHLRRIAVVLDNTSRAKKEKAYEGPKCQWCGDPMHKGTCPTISAMDYEYSDTGVPRTRRVEFFDKRRVTQNMSPEVIVATKKQE